MSVFLFQPLIVTIEGLILCINIGEVLQFNGHCLILLDVCIHPVIIWRIVTLFWEPVWRPNLLCVCMCVCAIPVGFMQSYIQQIPNTLSPKLYIEKSDNFSFFSLPISLFFPVTSFKPQSLFLHPSLILRSVSSYPPVFLPLGEYLLQYMIKLERSR